MIRKTHKKTRTGCLTCKRRRIKCDEAKPQCHNCEIHKASCVYEASKWQASTTPRPGQPEARICVPQSEDLVFSTTHMMLLHHYTTSTALTFHSDATLKVLWQVEAPQLGQSARFLLYAILGLASLHLAYLKPDQRHIYWPQGVELYQTALAGAKEEMQRVTDNNRAGLFLFSCLNCYFALARNRCAPKRSSGREQEDFLEWVFMFRGTRVLLTPPEAGQLESGPLAPMIEMGKKRVRLLDKLSASNPLESRSLDELQVEIRQRVVDFAELEAYEGALHLLQRSFNAVRHWPREGVQNTDIFVWIFGVSAEFVALLKERAPIAVAIFACFSVLFRRLTGAWWVEGWTDEVLDQVYPALEADQEARWLVERVQRVTQEESDGRLLA